MTFIYYLFNIDLQPKNVILVPNFFVFNGAEKVFFNSAPNFFFSYFHVTSCYLVERYIERKLKGVNWSPKFEKFETI